MRENERGTGWDMRGEPRHAIARVAVVPVLAAPEISSTQTSQYTLGHHLELTSKEGDWWEVRGEDTYEGWIHTGYLELGDERWATEWREGADGQPAVGLGATLSDETEQTLTHLPWGSRVVAEDDGWYRLPDRRRGRLATGEIVPAAELAARFPADGQEILESALGWYGTPYLWGGVTPGGVDCSGLVQAIYRMHGIPLPRDSYQQAEVGAALLDDSPGESDLSSLEPGDLLFFAEGGGRVTHVAISMGGSEIIHSALSNGGVATNDLEGDLELEKRLRDCLVGARRVISLTQG